MPRGRKPVNPQSLKEQMGALARQIEECETELKNLKIKKKELSKQIEAKQKDELYSAFMKSGKTLEDILAVLSEDDAAGAEEAAFEEIAAEADENSVEENMNN